MEIQMDSCSQLILDEGFFCDLLKYECCCEEPDFFSGYDWEICEISHDKFARSEIVDSILGHLGPIHKFSLHIPKNSNISRWMQLVSGKSVKELEVYQNHDDRKHLPANMLSSAGFDSLTHLTLHRCSLRSFQTTFRGFPSLVSLHLGVYSKVSLPNNYEILVSECPLLESFSLQNPFREEAWLRINAPKLKDLSVFGLFTGIFLEETKEIKTVLLNAVWQRWEDWPVEFFAHLSRVEKLNIRGLFLKGGWPEVGPTINLRPSTEFRELKELVIDGVELRTHSAISFIVCVLKVAPKLQKLDISVLHATESLQHNRFIDECDCHLNHLECAKLCCELRSSWITLQLVKLILSSSPMLKVMVVEVKTGYADRRDTQLLLERKLKIAKELLLYDRASANVKIIFET